MRLYLRLLCVSVSMTILVSTGRGADRYLVASCLEQAIRQDPCIIGELDTQRQTFRQVLSIPLAGGMWRIEGYPELRHLVVWGERGSGKNAYALVLPVDDLGSSRTVELPFPSIRKGVWLDHPSLGSSLVGIGLGQEDSPFLYSLRSKVSVRKNPEDIPWMNAVLLGSAKERAWSGCYFHYTVEKQTGKLISRKRGMSFPVEVSLNESSDELSKAPGNLYAMIWCNDSRQTVISAGVGDWRGKPRSFLVLNRETGKWHKFNSKEDDSSLQMFGEWFAVQETRNLKPNMAAPPTGEFGFHRRDGNGGFYWRATPDTEVLAIEGPRLFYRQGCGLMTADIEANRIINERVLFRSEDPKIQKILEQVHWLFPMNTLKQP